MKTFHSERRFHTRRGFTLIELMLATGLGLMLLVGLIKIIAMVNESFAETRVLIDLQNRCRSAQMLLQQDLSHISVTTRAPRPVQMDDGYLSLGRITANATDNSKLQRGNGGTTINLVDTEIVNKGVYDFAAFTVFNRENPFTFTDPSNVNRTIQTPYAEVVWFVYRNDLYRVVVPFVNSPEQAANYLGVGNKNNNCYISSQLPTVRMISPAMLGDLNNRLMLNHSNSRSFLWSYCETPQGNQLPTTTLGKQLANCMVLPNVINFRVQVWDPQREEYCDLPDTRSNTYYNGKTIRYANTDLSMTGGTIYYDTGSTLSYVGSDNGSTSSALGTYNSEVAYSNGNYFRPNGSDSYYRPPTTAFMPGMRIIVRAFDPDSGTVREFRVGQDFRMK